MAAACNAMLQDHYAVVEAFQLRDVEVPSSVDTAVLAKLVQNQFNKQVEKEQQSLIIRAETMTIESELSNKAVIAVAEAQSTASKIVNQAAADAVEIRLNASAAAYATIKADLEFTNDELLAYLYMEYVRQPDSQTTLALGIQTALVDL